jgi:hypothetical protein
LPPFVVPLSFGTLEPNLSMIVGFSESHLVFSPLKLRGRPLRSKG